MTFIVEPAAVSRSVTWRRPSLTYTSAPRPDIQGVLTSLATSKYGAFESIALATLVSAQAATCSAVPPRGMLLSSTLCPMPWASRVAMSMPGAPA